MRIEIGPKDIKEDKVMLVRRDNGKKESVKLKDLKQKVEEELEDIQKCLFNKAEKLLKENIIKVKNLKEIGETIKNKKIAFAPLCGDESCEGDLKTGTLGVKVLNVPEKQPSELEKSKCSICAKKADYFAYIGKSY